METDNIPLQYEMEKAIYSIANIGNRSRYYDILYRALEQGDMDSYQHIRDELMESTRDADGKIIQGESKGDHVRSWLEGNSGLNEAQRAFLWGSVYTSEW